MPFDTQEQSASVERRPDRDIAAIRRFTGDMREKLIREGPYDFLYAPQSDQSLFHYTDLGGLHGIVNSSDLWLTHSRYSNDDEEMFHGYRVARDLIKENERTHQNEPARIEYLKAVRKLLQEPVPEDVYICCFCKTDDLLSQWRSYGANGTGVSIEFDPMGFAEASEPDSLRCGLMWLWKVYYDPREQRKLLDHALNFGFDHEKGQQIPKEAARRAADAIEFFIPTFKNKDFAEESEYRLIFTPSTDCPVCPQFRVAREMLVPYYSLRELTSEFSKSGGLLPIRGVRIGPSVQKDLNVESAKLLLRKARYPEHVKVGSSDTPYRG